MQQAKEYAQILRLKFAYVTNGREIIAIDFFTGKETERKDFPAPDELWRRQREAPDAMHRRWKDTGCVSDLLEALECWLIALRAAPSDHCDDRNGGARAGPPTEVRCMQEGKLRPRAVTAE